MRPHPNRRGRIIAGRVAEQSERLEDSLLRKGCSRTGKAAAISPGQEARGGCKGNRMPVGSGERKGNDKEKSQEGRTSEVRQRARGAEPAQLSCKG